MMTNLFFTDNGPDLRCPKCSADISGEIGHNCDREDICGFCGLSGADKIPHPIRWPGEESAGTNLVHADCEREECRRAHAELSDSERRSFLFSIR